MKNWKTTWTIETQNAGTIDKLEGGLKELFRIEILNHSQLVSNFSSRAHQLSNFQTDKLEKQVLKMWKMEGESKDKIKSDFFGIPSI